MNLLNNVNKGKIAYLNVANMISQILTIQILTSIQPARDKDSKLGHFLPTGSRNITAYPSVFNKKAEPAFTEGVAIRGHTEEEGNLYQVLKCRCEGVPGLEAWLRKGVYRSHDIINELIELMCMKVLRKLLAEIRDAEWYSIIADETRDLSGAEQFSVSIRWVDSEYNISEDLIGMVEVENTTAEVLTSVIKDTLLRCVLPLSQCRGQAYDGAANMAGCISGVAKRLQEDEPSALFVHCLAHNLNLCLQDCGRQCDAV
ncbi:zinc finger MYM-type protein 1-like [Dendronephthya gigantea]|uniref:zinc finger MYM-type protein 1-like n=1 Tax=Dendronephthya gigantea TaxID=151771 RepID=UPI00106CD5E2|nr:zinc finger MYM-type protein 1-like [Dendronephthya gigantea]XP_028419287.1 zinc finger MYM-type protein 1-like [Dendronephthya gigantea]XP_028419295.1 zinc finger MYM-type protein 1-like [Dendronephthya gigantea]